MDKVEVKNRKIERELNQQRKDYINYAHKQEITYQKKAALERALSESDEKELMDLASLRALLVLKEKIEKTVNIDEMIFYLKLCIQRIMKSQELLLMIFQPKRILLKQ